jgi:WD40 repeat protein
MKADPQQTHIAQQWPHASPLICCRFNPAGDHVFASTEDYAVQRWRLADGQKTSYPPAHDSWVGSMAFVDGGRMLVTAGFDGRLKWWPATAEKPEPLRSIDAHRGWVRAVAVSPDGKWIASGGNDRLVKIWSAADGTLVRELSGHRSHVYSTIFHPSGKWILSGELLGEIRQWDAATGQLVRTFDGKPLHTYEGGQQVDYGGVRSLSVTADGGHLAAGGLYNASNPLGAVNDPLVLLFQWSDQKKVRSHVIGGVQGVIWRVIAHPDGFLIGGSGGSGGGYVAFWKTDTDKEFFKLQMPNTVRDLDLHPDGIRLATAHHDRHVRILRMAPKTA